MEKRTKALRPVDITSVEEVMDDLAKTLSGNGPALSFGAVTSAHVEASIQLVVATSGSTGQPKEVGLSARALRASTRGSNKFLNAQIGDTWSLLLPLTHIAGINVLLRSLEVGTIAVDLRKATSYPKVDFTAIVPTQLFRALHGEDELLHHLRGCKAVLVGGAALSPNLFDQGSKAGISLVTTYGMTETSGGCVYNGEPLDGVEIEIHDGHIAIRGDVLANGYLNDELEWNERFIDGWFRTPDTGRLDSGKLTIVGRSDEVIISGGENLSLVAVEESLRAAFPQYAFAAFALEDAQWGSALHIAMAGDFPFTNGAVADALTQRLGALASPKGFLRVREIPVLALGKIDRQALTKQALLELPTTGK